MWDGRDCLSQGGQETERGYRKRPGQPIAPKNMPHCDLLPLGRRHLLNFLQPSKIMPLARYWKFRTRDGERQWPVKFKIEGGQKMIARNMVFSQPLFLEISPLDKSNHIMKTDIKSPSRQGLFPT